MSPVARMLRNAALVALGVYLAIAVAAKLLYPRLLYPAPRTDKNAPGEGRLLELRASDGVVVHAIELALPKDGPVVVYFHGNGVTVGDDLWIGRELVQRGLGVVLCEYRGYGLSASGTPSEDGLYRDAEAVLDDLAARGIGKDRVVLFGVSLGTGVASEMAARGRGRAVILVTPYTSITAMGEHFTSRLPILPVRLLMTDRFATIEKAPRTDVPALVIHGTDDEVAAAFPRGRLVTVPGGHHNDLFLGPGWRFFDEVARFARTGS